MKSYRCKFCKREGTRKEIRACLMTHIKNNKTHGDRKTQDKRSPSNISESLIKKDLKGVET
jgi:hypothetical protein